MTEFANTLRDETDNALIYRHRTASILVRTATDRRILKAIEAEMARRNLTDDGRALRMWYGKVVEAHEPV